MKIKDIICVLEKYAPPELQESYDNVGLQTGMNGWDCSGVLCALDVTIDVIEEAIHNNCNLIIAHHPVIFNGLKKINGTNLVERELIHAIKNDIAIYAMHTNLDNMLLGVNGMIAHKLGLNHIAILQPVPKILRRLITFAPLDKSDQVRQAIFNAGAGQIGKYEECSFTSEGLGTFKASKNANPYVGKVGERHMEKETKIEIVYPFYLERQVIEALLKNHPYEEVAYDIYSMENVHYGIGAGVIGELEVGMSENEFLEMIYKTFTSKGIRHTGLRNQIVKRVAVCGGAGSFLIKNALEKGADFFITADVKYHQFFEPEGRMVLADIGHYESEQFTIELIHDILAEKFTTFAILKTKVNTNPIRYFKSEFEN